MNKFYFILSLFLVLAGQSLAQSDIKAIIGKPYSFVESSRQFYVADKSGFLIIKLWAKKLILQKIGPDLTLQNAMQYESFPKDFTVMQVFVLKGKCFLFYSATTKKLPSLFVAQVDVAKGELLDAGREIVSPSDEIDDDISNKKSYQFLLSHDSSHLAVCYKIKSNSLTKSKNSEVNGVWVFDGRLTERWHAELVLPYNEKKSKVEGRGIDSNGNVHLALRVINDDSGLEKKYGQTTPNYSIELLSYKSPSETPRVTTFKLEDKFLNSFSFDGSTATLVCSGFYDSGEINDDDPEGIFTAGFSSQTASGTTFIPFPLSVANEGEGKLKQNTNEKLIAKGKPLQIKGLQIVQIIPQADGGMLLFAEQHKEIITKNYNPSTAPGVSVGVGVSSITHVYENIIVARVLPDGKLGWMRKLLKATSAQTGDYQYKQNNKIHSFLFTEDDELFEYRLNDVTGEGEKKMITKFKPLLKRPHALFTSHVGTPTLLPEGSAVVLEAHLSGDAGKFGETKPYKEDVLVKVIID